MHITSKIKLTPKYIFIFIIPDYSTEGPSSVQTVISRGPATHKIQDDHALSALCTISHPNYSSITSSVQNSPTEKIGDFNNAADHTSQLCDKPDDGNIVSATRVVDDYDPSGKKLFLKNSILPN